MIRERIKLIALACGFKLKQQADGSEDLNPYVYEAFAEFIKRNGEAATFYIACGRGFVKMYANGRHCTMTQDIREAATFANFEDADAFAKRKVFGYYAILRTT